MGMVKDAARLCTLPTNAWIRRTIIWEALRVRMAAQNVPNGLHPGTPVYRVLRAPVAGSWFYELEFVADGTERVWVSSMVENAPVHVAPDQKALVIDVVGHPVYNLLVAATGLRWTVGTPFSHHHWPAQQAALDEYAAAKEKARAHDEDRPAGRPDAATSPPSGDEQRAPGLD